MKTAVVGVVVFVALMGCSGSGTTGAGGGGGGTAGGAGGGTGGGLAADASVFTNADSSAAFAAFGPTAAITISLRADAGSTDGGPVPVIDLGPDGLTFSPAGAAGALFESYAFPDGGVMLPFWGLVSSDGGSEPTASFTSMGLLPSGGASGHVLVAVPHFSSAAYFPGAAAKISFDPEGAEKEVGEIFAVYAEIVATNGMAEGTATLEGFGALGVPSTTYTFNKQRRLAFMGLSAYCAVPGLGELVLSGTFTAYVESGWNSALTMLPPQSFRISRRIFCRASLPPPLPDPVAALPQRSGSDPRTDTPPPMAWDPLSTLLGGALAFTPGEALTTLTARLRPECGTLNTGGPCPIDEPFNGVAEYNRTGPGQLQIRGMQLRSQSPKLLLPAEQVLLISNYDSNLGDPKKFVARCLAPGRFALELTGELRRATDALWSPWVPAVFGRTAVQCGGTGDAVMLSDNARLTRTGSTWSAAAAGTTFNLIAAASAVEAKFGALNDQSVGYDNVTTFTSVPGFPRFAFQSGRQDGGLTFTNNRYAGAGFGATAAFNASDTFTVTAFGSDGGVGQFPDGGLAIVSVPAPPPLPDPNQLFGARAGLSTPVRLPDGTFDVLYVFAGGTSPRGGEGGIFRTVSADDMLLDAGIREAPLMDPAGVRALAAWGISPTTIYVAAFRQRQVEGLFFATDGGPRPVPVQAGRMVNFARGDLAP